VIRFARESGFTLAEIRRLFAGRRYSRQLHRLALRKVAELEEAIRRARTMQLLLRSALRCKCLTVEECGRRLSAVTLPGAVKAPVGRPMPARPVHRSRGPSAPLE